ncbi:MAG: VOC family protein [Pseudomonadales bacterium]|nr:VOC family protein [Pseudomonadales bacterium]
MISHTTIGTNDPAKSEYFYSNLLPLLGGSKLLETDRAIFWQFGENSSKLAISKPFDGNTATAGNGTMVAFTVESKDKVEEVYAKALALGATSEGEPGDRYDGLYYGAYFRDYDGNKMAVFFLL